MAGAIDRIFTVNLGVKKTERVLVLTDVPGADEKLDESGRAKRKSLKEIARETAETGKRYCNTEYLEFHSVNGHGKEPPKEAWRAAFGTALTDELESKGILGRILGKTASHDEIDEAEDSVRSIAVSPDAIIALSRYSTSHTRFRDFLTRLKGVRYASMPLFERYMLSGSMSADWKEVEARTLRLVEMISGASTVYLTSRNGTSISFSMEGRDPAADTGILTRPGSFGNLPAGEAFLAPLEGTAEGTLVLEWGPSKKFDVPITLDVKKGVVVNVSGDDEFSEGLRERLRSNPLIGNIAELGIGTNERAERPDNILETEKILGTVHIAIGDNSSFGGRVSVPYHQDFIFFSPTLEVIRGEEKIEVIVDGETRF